MEVSFVFEGPRGCGYRSPGKDGVGVYLRGSPFNEACERLPWLLDVCPCCGAGFKPTRGFTWINPMSLFDPYATPQCTARDDYKHDHERCWMCNPELLGSKAGLIWIGEKHYPTPRDFLIEADRMGISRKLGAIPNGFEVGTHVIFLAHRKTFVWPEEKPGVFAAFRPTHVELVINDENNVPNKAIELAKRIGTDKCSIIKVIRDTEEETEDAWGDWEEI